MGYSANMDGLDLFTAPFRNPQAFRMPETSRPRQSKATALQSKVPVSMAQQSKTAEVPSQPIKPKAPISQPQQTDILQKAETDEKISALQVEQGEVIEPTPEQKPHSEPPVSVKEHPSVQTQPEQPIKELSLDMSDHTIPAGKPLDATEDAKRKAHEEAEAKRKAEWESRQLAKKQARETALKTIRGMGDDDVVLEATNRICADIERITRRNMKECVAEHIQKECRKDPEFARQTMYPQKSMIHCFQYIDRKARDYIEQEMKDNGCRPENGVYGGDVPDDLCYQWGIDYFNDMDALEDKEKEEPFVSHPYVGTASKTNTKKTVKKEPKKKPEPEKDYQQMSFTEVL